MNLAFVARALPHRGARQGASSATSSCTCCCGTPSASPRSRAPEHLALDAVINAIIHRSLGPDYSGMMSRYYADERGVARLLRPPTDEEQDARTASSGRLRTRAEEQRVLSAWEGLYDGRSSPTTFAISRAITSSAKRPPESVLLGNHDDLARDIRAPATADGSAVLADALDTRAQGHERLGHLPQPERAGRGRRGLSQRGARRGHRRGPMAARDVRRAAASPAARPAVDRARARRPRSFTLPVLSPGDRRAALRSLWSPFLPDARWETRAHRARRLGPRLSRRQRLDERGDAAHRRAARAAVAVHPPAVLGVQQRRRAGAHRAGPA